MSDFAGRLVARLKQDGTRKGLVILLDQCVVSGTNFLVGLILGRLLLPAEFGAYTLAFGTLNAVNSFFQEPIILGPILVFGASKEGRELRSYVAGTTTLQALVSLLTTLLILALAGVLSFTKPSLVPAFLGLAALIGVEQMQEYLRCALLARRRVVSTLVNDSIYAALRLGALAFLVLASRHGNPSILSSRAAQLCAALGAAVASAFGCWQIRSLLADPVSSLPSATRENWKFGKWGLAAAGASTITRQLSPWLLTGLQGAATLGALGACQTIVFASNPIINSLVSYWAPITARDFATKGVAALRGSVRRYALMSFVVMGTFCGLIVVASHPILHFLYAGKYDGNALILSLLALAAFLMSLNRPSVAALGAMKRPDLNFAAQTIALVLSLVLTWPAIRYFGLMGFAGLQLLNAVCMLFVRNGLRLHAERLEEQHSGAAKGPGGKVPMSDPGPGARPSAAGGGAPLRILVVGQTPPPYGGQAIMIQEILSGTYGRVRLFHVRLAFSREMDEMGKFSPAKIFRLFGTIVRIWFARFRHRTPVLYYPPSGPGTVPVLRDIVLLGCTRWIFRSVVFHFHAAGVSTFAPSLLRPLRPLFRMAYGRPALAIRTSSLNPDDGAGFGAARNVVVPYGIPDSRGSVPERRAGPGEEAVILFAGVLIRSKGVRVLVEAFDLLVRGGARVRLQLMGRWGDPSFESEVTQLIVTRGLQERVQVLGVKSGATKFGFFAGCDIFCFPSFFESESFGLVLLEAMQFGKPVVATNWRGIPSVVEDGASGFLVKPGDAAALAEKLLRLLSDPALRRDMGDRGRRLFEEKFTARRFHENMESALMTLAESTGD